MLPPVVLTTNGDQISQEGDEDFFLQLSAVTSFPSNLFLRDTLRIVISDETGKASFLLNISRQVVTN